jgi:hypothetical protein
MPPEYARHLLQQPPETKQEHPVSEYFGHDKSELEPVRGETRDQERVRTQREQQAIVDATPEAQEERRRKQELKEFCAWLLSVRGSTNVHWSMAEAGPTRLLATLNPQWGDDVTAFVVGGKSLTFRFTSSNCVALARAGLRPNEWAFLVQTEALLPLAETVLVPTPGGGLVDGAEATAMGIEWGPLP